MTSPTQRSLQLLRKDGFTAQVVEHWNAFAHIRQDLFGFIDIVAISDNRVGVLGIQATSQTNVSHRLEKCLPMESLKLWLMAGNTFEVHGWGKKGKRGERKLWKIDRRVITLLDLQ
jgi:hypothetical protein